MTVIVTAHAAERYCQRIDPTLTPAEARTTILRSAPVIEKAAAFGCSTVRTCAAKLILDGWAVVTVLPRRGFGSARA